MKLFDKIMFTIFIVIQLVFLVFVIGWYDDLKLLIAHCTTTILLTIWIKTINIDLGE